MACTVSRLSSFSAEILYREQQSRFMNSKRAAYGHAHCLKTPPVYIHNGHFTQNERIKVHLK